MEFVDAVDLLVADLNASAAREDGDALVPPDGVLLSQFDDAIGDGLGDSTLFGSTWFRFAIRLALVVVAAGGDADVLQDAGGADGLALGDLLVKESAQGWG